MSAGRVMTKFQVPGVGMRGGLGRTLLISFLALAILPLSIISWYATQRNRTNIQEQVTAKLTSIAILKEDQLTHWVEEQSTVLAEIAAELQDSLPDDDSDIRMLLTQETLRQPVIDLALVGPEGQVRESSSAVWVGQVLPLDPERAASVWVVQASLDVQGRPGLVLIGPLAGDVRWPYVAARVSAEGLARIMTESAGLSQTVEAYIVDHSGMALPQGRWLSGPAIQAARVGQEDVGLYQNYDDVPVIGVYRWLPTLNLALIVEQSQKEAFASNDDVIAAVIAATLGVALVTAVIAAFVTRQITRPVVNLTESALHIAAGDLSHRVQVTSRDEIGILAGVFNQMTAELEVLYNDLEAKVVERTRLLQQANYQIQRRAIQTQTSLEVGQAVTSILDDPDRLLQQVVQVVKDRFIYSYVAVYTADERGENLILRAAAGEADPFRGQCVPADLAGPVGRAFRDGKAALESRSVPVTVGPPISYTRSEVALPLCVGDRHLGVMDVQCTDQEDFDPDDVSVLQNVANQISTALENARAYAAERQAVEQLRELDQSKRLFLANMSHELRTPLTNIIGFSRLMLKGLEGPISDLQRQDLDIIHHNGQHLLGLVGDLLDISQIEAGLMELELRDVDLAELSHSVMATASALAQSKTILLREEITPDLSPVRADPTRIRQVLLRLLAHAVKSTAEGTITLHIRSADSQVLVSVSGTGTGVPGVNLERLFDPFDPATAGENLRANGTRLGLALSKEFVEMHGGEMWVESEAGKGATFTFTLPAHPIAPVETTAELPRRA